MTPFTRIGSYVILLLGLILGAVVAQDWLQRQTQAQIRQLNEAAIAAKEEQFRAAVARLKINAHSTAAELQELGRTINATVSSVGADNPSSSSPPRPAGLSFEAGFGPGTRLQIVFPVPAATRLLGVYHRITLGLLLLCPALFVIGLLLANIARRPAIDDRQSRTPWAREKAQALGLEHFARMSVERKAEFEREADARRRAEEDLQTNRSLLTLSQEERAQLGRELHDNICQTLYAVCLTLDSIRQKISTTPTNQERFDQCLGELRRLNAEVRAYLRELEPDEIQRHSFDEAVAHMVSLLPADAGVRIVRQFDEETIARIPARDTAPIINILREAVSNALRHGQARTITLRAEHSEDRVALAVQDDGIGFAATGRQSPDTGHGLGNMRARAIALGGELRVDSAPGKGTRVLLTVPVASAG